MSIKAIIGRIWRAILSRTVKTVIAGLGFISALILRGWLSIKAIIGRISGALYRTVKAVIAGLGFISALILRGWVSIKSIIGKIWHAILSRAGMEVVAGLIWISTLILLFSVDLYFVQLIVFFIMCISLFHFILARWTQITKRFVKSTDYYYFMFAVVGVLFAAIAQEGERNISYVNLVLSGITIDPDKIAIGVKEVVKWCDKFPWLDENVGNPISRYATQLIYGSRLDSKLCELLVKTDYILSNQSYSDHAYPVDTQVYHW